MNRQAFLFFSIVVFIIFQSCKSTKQALPELNQTDFRVGFYNVENLFDTIDIEGKIDEEFTPGTKKKWNTERYFKKLNDLAKIVEAIQYPEILGLCEVENKAVLRDFISKTSLKKFDYGLVHYESPDQRGIDVALIYQKRVFEVLSSDKIRIDFPEEVSGEENYTSRDILYVKGIFARVDTMHLFINHFPSRRGGVKKSQPKRLHVAKYLKKAVDQILSKNKNANIILTGDFNDETNNNSITKILEAKGSIEEDPGANLINCSAKLDKEGKGTYNFRGNWNMLDQMIISSGLLKNNQIKVGQLGIFQEEWMMYKSDRFGWTPNRTYGGPNYYGGYSDHLPIFLELTLNK